MQGLRLNRFYFKKFFVKIFLGKKFFKKKEVKNAAKKKKGVCFYKRRQCFL
jgi:hypothetical protein